MNERASRADAFTAATFAFREDVHDAWRSTVTDPSEVLAHDDIWGTPDARALCASTSRLVFRLIENQIKRRQDVDASAIYDMMERLYVLAGFASLADPLYRQMYWDERCYVPGLLELPGIQAAAADGERILYSVRTATSYNQSLGFALEAIADARPTNSEEK